VREARQRSDSQAPPRTIPELESRVRKVLERTHTPGISIAVAANTPAKLLPIITTDKAG